VSPILSPTFWCGLSLQRAAQGSSGTTRKENFWKTSARVCVGLVCKGLGFPAGLPGSPSAARDCSPVVPLVPAFSLSKQSKLEKRGIFRKVPSPPFQPVARGRRGVGKLWGCLSSICSIPPRGREVGHGRPFPPVNGTWEKI